VALTKTFNRRRLPLVAANDDRPPRRHSECTESDLSTFRLHVSFRQRCGDAGIVRRVRL